jgi:F-type H+-transporting ATPase subunit beta
MKGQLVPLKDTVDAFEAILEGKGDALPESAFYMVGNFASIEEKAAKELEATK